MDIATLSRTAQEKYLAVQAKLEEIVNSDRSREPKLSQDESNEVHHWELEVRRLSDRLPILEQMLAARTERLDELNANAVSMVVDGLEPDDIGSEFAALTQSVELLRRAVGACFQDREMAAQEIIKIKQIARDRELKGQE